jgi:hypothetical protein
LSPLNGCSKLARVAQLIEAGVTETEKSSRHWSDQKADIVALLTIFTALLLAAINFISRQV